MDDDGDENLISGVPGIVFFGLIPIASADFGCIYGRRILFHRRMIPWVGLRRLY